MTRSIGDDCHVAAEYERNIQNQSEGEAQKQATYHIRCSSGEHRGQNDRCNNHHLLNESNERAIRAESPQDARARERKIREKADEMGRQSRPTKARTILRGQCNCNSGHGRPENSILRARLDYALQRLDLRRGNKDQQWGQY